MTLLRRLVAWPYAKLRARADASSISAIPWLPPGLTALLNRLLTDQVTYLEYGAGSSTLFALERAKSVISVESDKHWMRAVLHRVPERHRAKFTALPVDIGATGRLGLPVFRSPTQRRRAKWETYPLAPWRQGASPDVILIDGRFRVACAAATLLHARPGSIVIIDDFAEEVRGYGAVLPLLTATEVVDRAMVFGVPADLDRTAAAAILARAVLDPR
jgi:hypothetical protein